MFLENRDLVPRVLVEPNLTNSENIASFKELRDDFDDVFCQPHVFRLLRVDAQPGVMAKPVLRCALWLVVCKLAKIVVETINTASVKTGPECRFTDRYTPC